VRIGADLKTISMWNVKQESLRAKLHREIIERDYHLSAAMYCETAALDQFFWIFVNKDENYHWIAIIEASAELLELGCSSTANPCAPSLPVSTLANGQRLSPPITPTN
jgi:exodeoxyribonuclease VIII